MVLRVRTSEQMKKITAKLNEPMSGKKPKSTSSKKKTSRIDALKPKKPPTAFFYFLYVYSSDLSLFFMFLFPIYHVVNFNHARVVYSY